MTETVLGVQTVLIPVTDLAAAKATYTALFGAEPTNDAPYYVGYDVAGQQIGLVPGGHDQGLPGPTPHWHVTDLDAVLAAVTAAGGTVANEPRNVGGSRMVATFTDPDGNTVGLIED